jgi:hypothetical protein
VAAATILVTAAALWMAPASRALSPEAHDAITRRARESRDPAVRRAFRDLQEAGVLIALYSPGQTPGRWDAELAEIRGEIARAESESPTGRLDRAYRTLARAGILSRGARLPARARRALKHAPGRIRGAAFLIDRLDDRIASFAGSDGSAPRIALRVEIDLLFQKLEPVLAANDAAFAVAGIPGVRTESLRSRCVVQRDRARDLATRFEQLAAVGLPSGLDGARAE